MQLVGISIVVGALLMLSTKLIDPPPSKGKKNVIYVYNWGEYIDPDLTKKFENKQVLKSCTKRLIPMKR